MNEAESLIRNVTELYLDLVCDFSLPDDLTDELYRVILDLEKNMNSGYTVRKTGYVLKYSDSQPRDDHGRWTDGDGGGSDGSVAGNTETASNAHPRNEELEKLIKKCIDEPEPVFAEDLRKNYLNIPKEKGKYIIAMHGTAESVELFGTKVDEKVLANIIKNRKDYNDQDEIVLISCNTGNETSGKKNFAQKFADKINKIVYAPTKYGAISADGKYFSSNAKGTRKEGTFKKFKPKIE